MQRFEEGPLKVIGDKARTNIVQSLETASDADKQVFVQIEIAKIIVAAIEAQDIPGAKAEVIAEIKKIPRSKQGRRGIERTGLVALGGIIGGAVAEFIARFKGS